MAIPLIKMPRPGNGMHRLTSPILVRLRDAVFARRGDVIIDDYDNQKYGIELSVDPPGAPIFRELAKIPGVNYLTLMGDGVRSREMIHVAKLVKLRFLSHTDAMP